jgi:hypothetical protein
MSIRILVGTEPGSNFKHACFWDSTTDIAFGPVFYEGGKPSFLDPGDIAEAFGKWVGWDALAVMTVAEMKDKQHELETLMLRDPSLARADGAAAGKLAVEDMRGTSAMERIEEASGGGDDAGVATGMMEARDDAWGGLSTDGAHPWAIVLDQERVWMEGFREGFLEAFKMYLAEAKRFYETEGRQ